MRASSAAHYAGSPLRLHAALSTQPCCAGHAIIRYRFTHMMRAYKISRRQFCFVAEYPRRHATPERRLVGTPAVSPRAASRRVSHVTGKSWRCRPFTRRLRRAYRPMRTTLTTFRRAIFASLRRGVEARHRGADMPMGRHYAWGGGELHDGLVTGVFAFAAQDV